MEYSLNTFGRKWFLALVICCLGAGTLLRALDKRKQAEALALMQKVHDVCGLRAPGSPPFHMEGRFTFFGMAQGTAEGKYVLDWVSPDQWREEISFPGFSQTRVGGKDKVWLRRNIPFRPLRIQELVGALTFSHSDTPQRRQKIKAFRRKKIEGELLDCIESQPGDLKSQSCFDPLKGVIVRKSDAFSTTEFMNYADLGEKLYPRTIRVAQDDKPAIKVELTAQLVTGEPDPRFFLPPDGSVEWRTCANPEFPKPIAEPEPPYPKSARRAHVEGHVVAYILIDPSGDVSSAAILQSLGPEFDAGTLETLKTKWKFKPAMCGSVPIPYETDVDVDFRIPF